MATETQEKGERKEGDAALVQEILDNFALAYEFEKDNREAAEADLKILSGKTWREEDKQQRQSDGRPCMQFPVLNQYTDQVIGDWRQNRAEIVARPGEGQMEPRAFLTDQGKEIKAHEAYAGLLRAIAADGGAREARDMALEQVVSCGFGHYRVVTEYAKTGFDQTIQYKRIVDQFSVYWDPASYDFNREDAMWCIISVEMPRVAFERQHPESMVSDLPVPSHLTSWFGGDTVRICEYFRKVPVEKTIVLLSDGRVVDADDLEPIADELAAQGVTVVKDRTITDHQIEWYKATGVEILERQTDYPGRYIPIISVWGKEQNCGNGRLAYRSLIRYAHDAQRMFDYLRPLALDTPLPTPTGWTTMGAVKVGDHLLDDSGLPTRVIGVSPVHVHRDCFRVRFSDGSSIVADAEHPWPVEERGKRTAQGQTWTSELRRTDELRPGDHFINVAQPLQLPETELPIDPYVLGIWLADGTAIGGRVTEGAEDVHVIREQIIARGHDVKDVCFDRNGAGTFRIVGLTTQLRSANLINNKHIPDVYLRASEDQRRSLLQGLMDGDGNVHRQNGNCSFVTTTPALANGVHELLRSLGIRPTRARRPGNHSRLVGYDVTLKDYDEMTFTCPPGEAVFWLPRKAERQQAPRKACRRRTKRHGIVAVEPVASVPVKCVRIEAASHLFLAGEGMIPTHNTAGIERIALEPKVPFVIGTSQIGDYSGLWQTANSVNHAYLPFDDSQNTNPPQRQFPAQAATGILQEAGQAREDIKGAIGMYDASIGNRSNETSGKAILARQRESDIMSFPFIDNMGRAMNYETKVVADLVPHIFDNRRAARILNADESEMRIVLNDEIRDEQTGQMIRLNDLSICNFEVSVDIGPSYTTLRQETSEQMLQFIQAVPAAGALTGDLIAKMQDWNGADQYAKRLRYLLPPEIREAEDMEASGEQPVPAHIQMQLDQANQMLETLQAQLQQVMPELEKAQGEITKAQMDADRAKVQQTLDKQASDLKGQQASLDYDKRVMALEKALTQMQESVRTQTESDTGQMMQAHQEIMGRTEQAMAAFQAIGQQIADGMQQNGEAIRDTAQTMAQSADQIAAAATLITQYLRADRVATFDEQGNPVGLRVEGFGEIRIQ